MTNQNSASTQPPMDDFQKRLLEMSPDEIRERLYCLPFEKIEQVFLNVRPLPPAQLTKITVKRNSKGVPTDLVIEMVGWKTLRVTEQIAWTSPDGKLEIRFDPRLSPFGGASFEVPQGAKSFSGRPDPKKLSMKSFRYTVLVTTPDGFFLKKDTEVVIERPSSTKK